MVSSLRFRLLLAVGLVVLAAVVAVGLVSTVATRLEFEHYLEVERTFEGSALALDLDELARQIGEHHGREGWDGIQGLLDGILPETADGRRLLLLGPEGRLLFASGSVEELGTVRRRPDGSLETTRTMETEGGERRHEVAVFQGPMAELTGPAGENLGTLHLLPKLWEHAEPPASPPAGFLRSASRWRWLAVLAAGVLALVATGAVARKILRPVEELTEAARRMAAGGLDHRVRVTSRDEVGALGLAFNQMAESLERQERLRRQMVTDVAHDLRTPLTNIRGQIEAMQDGLVDPGPEVLASLHEEVMFLSRLVSDLQDLSLVEAGKLRLELQPFHVGEEIERVVQALPPEEPGEGPVIELDLPDLPEALADPARFRQIVSNLLSNARTHTPRAGRIGIRAREIAGEIEISVQDAGSGIESRHLPHVFERFYRADASRGRHTGGAGLGLAIVKHLVSVQGGRVWAESTPGEGALFGFTVPKAGAP